MQPPKSPEGGLEEDLLFVFKKAILSYYRLYVPLWGI